MHGQQNVKISCGIFADRVAPGQLSIQTAVLLRLSIIPPVFPCPYIFPLTSMLHNYNRYMLSDCFY